MIGVATAIELGLHAVDHDLGNAVGVAPLGAVIARRGSCRFFLIAAHDAHRDRLNDRLGRYKVTWKGHAELIECGG